MLRKQGAWLSTSRKGNCLDSAGMEDTFGLLKSGSLYLQNLTSRSAWNRDRSIIWTITATITTTAIKATLMESLLSVKSRAACVAFSPKYCLTLWGHFTEGRLQLVPLPAILFDAWDIDTGWSPQDNGPSPSRVKKILSKSKNFCTLTKCKRSCVMVSSLYEESQ